MPKTLQTWIAAALAIAPAVALAGCDEPWTQVIRKRQPQVGNPTDGPNRKNTCLSDIMYLVEGDTFTYMSAGQQTFGRGSSGQSPYGWRPDIEPRAQSKLDLDGYAGEASLLWNDVVVETFEIDRTFLMSDEVAILAHEDPDGTRVELHVYAQPTCGAFPAAVSTRAQIEELER
jgi:hypothetical protein